MFRILVVLLCTGLLAGCSPTFDWRPVAFGQGGASGVLPDSPRAQTRQVSFDSHDLALTMTSARADGVLFALGAAPLPADLATDEPARHQLALWAIESFYRNAGAPPPVPTPLPGQRFSIQGQGPQGPVRIDAIVTVTDSEWLEAVVIAPPDAFPAAPVDDFWLSLRWPAPRSSSARPADQGAAPS